MSAHPPPHVISPAISHTHTLILLHGRGSSGPEFASELLESTTTTNHTIAQELPSWKLVFPTALSRHSTVFQEDMTEWFDIYSLTDPAVDAELQLEGLREGIAYVRALVTAELEDVPAERLVVGGISQGAAVAVHALMGGMEIGLGGFVGLSTWMPFASEVRRAAGKGKELSEFYGSTLGVEDYKKISEGRQDVLDTSVLMVHSADDDVVDITLGREMKGLMEALGFSVEWREYDNGGHWIQEPQGINDLVNFLGTVAE